MSDVVHFSNNVVGVLYDIDSNTFLPMSKSDYVKVIEDESFYDKTIHEAFDKKNKLEIVSVKSFKVSKVINQIKIIVQNGCNLRCKYCYANGGTYNFEQDHFTSKTITEYLELLLENGIYNVKRVVFFGGEPTEYPEVIEATCNFFEKKYRERKLKTKPQYSMVSNGIIYTRQLSKLIKDYEIILTLSLDGPKCINDKLRVFSNEKGSFDLFKKNYKKMVKDGVYPALIEVTYTKLHKKLGYSKINILDYIGKEFPYSKIYIADCSGEYGISYTLNEKFEDFCINFDSTINKILNGNHIFDRDYFKIILRFCKKDKIKETRCNIVSESLTIYPNGNIYPCQLMTEDRFLLGNIKDGAMHLDKNNEVYNKLLLTGRKLGEQCSKCWLKNICDKCPRNDMVENTSYKDCDFCRQAHEYALLKLTEIYLDKEKWHAFCENMKSFLNNHSN